MIQNKQPHRSKYQIIKDIQKKTKTGTIEAIHIAKCFLLICLVDELKLNTFVEILSNDDISLFSVSKLLKQFGGKAYGIAPNTFKQQNSKHVSRNIKGSSDISVETTDNFKLYLNILEQKIALELDETITLLRKPLGEAFTFFKEKGIMIDALYINGNCNEFSDSTNFLSLVGEGGIIIIDFATGGNDHLIYDSIKREFIILFECDSFGILLKKLDYKNNAVQIEHLQKKLITSFENVLKIEEKSKPTITVGVVAYNIGEYIQECLTSIIHQRGNFKQDILVFEDCSTDCTFEKIQEFISQNEIPSNMTLQVFKNEKNIGLVKNYQRLIRKANSLGNDFFSIVDGDDYLLDGFRNQKLINLLNINPDFALSYSSILVYEENSNRFRTEESMQQLSKSKYTLFDLLANNFMAACSVVRGKAVQQIPDELFDMYTADWFLHIFFSQFGDIGFLKEPMFVYRRHEGGNWSSKTPLYNARRLFEAINRFNKFTNYKYYPYMLDFQMNLYNQLYDEPFEELDLLIVDDVFPHPSNGYRLQEFTSYLEHFKNIKILSTGVWTHLIGTQKNEDILADYKRLHPEIADKVVGWRGYSFYGNISCKLAYICFLGNVFPCIDILERLKIPFVLELYPGGSFYLNNDESDFKLRRVLSSKYFKKVIVTQKATYDYLIKKHFCSKEKILNIFGVVMPIDKLNKKFDKMQHYGFEKQTLDICFVAMKYTKYGREKGYDIFINVARELCKRFDNINFHVVGGFGQNVLDVSEIKDRITFYGYQTLDWFDQFYLDKDIILSPNTNGIVNKGFFDGFPTAACTDAGLRETAIFCTDPLGLNNGHYSNMNEIEIIEHDVSQIVERIVFYYLNPKALLNLSQNGSKRIKEIYSYENQMVPRIDLLEKEILAFDRFKEEEERNETDLIVPGRVVSSFNETTMSYAKTGYDEMVISRTLKIASFIQRVYVLLAPPYSRRAWILDRLIKFGYYPIKKINKNRKLKAELPLIRSSGLFDEEWYLSKYPDVAQAKVDPARHYIEFGGTEGRDPGPNFSSDWYLSIYPDVKVAKVNPLLHYLKIGKNEGRYPRPKKSGSRTLRRAN